MSMHTEEPATDFDIEYQWRKAALDDAMVIVGCIIESHPLTDPVVISSAGAFGATTKESAAWHRTEMVLNVASWLLKEMRP